MKRAFSVLSIAVVIFLQAAILGFRGTGIAHAEQSGVVYEAENAASDGILIDGGSVEGITFSNKAYMLKPDQYIEFDIEAPTEGFYSVNVCFYGYFQGTIALNGDRTYTLYIPHTENTNYTCAERIFISKGRHKIKFECDEKGYCAIDYLTVEFVQEFDLNDSYTENYKLSNPNASTKTKELFEFIRSNYGKKIISGQNAIYGYNDPDFQRVKEKTGQVPAMIGIDLGRYTTALSAYQDNAVENAIEFAALGGIVNLHWHWVAPLELLKKDGSGKPVNMWSGFRTQNVDMDFKQIMNDENSSGYKALMHDMDYLATHLKRLTDADIPVLFRPLHEASGGWFWWGTGGSEPYIELWRKMYDKFTNEYKMNNIIWVWNGQSRDWYPGDEYVDIVGEDIYLDAKTYSANSFKFKEAAGYPNSKKITALTECGVLIDVDEAVRNNTMWSWFLNWTWIHTIPKSDDEKFPTDAQGNPILDENGNTYEIQTELYMWNKVYNHDRVITLGDLPFHSHTDEDGDKICDVCNHGTANATEPDEPDPPNKPDSGTETDISDPENPESNPPNGTIIAIAVTVPVALALIAVGIAVAIKRKGNTKRRN